MVKNEHKKIYYPGLDALRLFAIIGVIGYHYYPQHLPGGFIGVDLFFVLSGFLLAHSLIPRLERGRSLNYAALVLRRVIRLWLPLFFMLVVSIALINLIAPDFLYNVRAAFLSALTFTNNWWQISQGASYFAEFVHPSAYTHLWYVALQMQLYIVFPILIWLAVRLLRDRRLITVSFIILAAVSALAMALLFQPDGDPSRIYYGTDTRAFAFALGIAAAAYRPRKIHLTFPIRDMLSIVSLVVLIMLSRSLMDQAAVTYRGGMLIAAVVSAVLVRSLATTEGFVAPFFGIKPFNVTSKIVYSLYLWYYPVYAVCGRLPHIQKMPLLQFVILIVLAIITYIIAEAFLAGRINKALFYTPTREERIQAARAARAAREAAENRTEREIRAEKRRRAAEKPTITPKRAIAVALTVAVLLSATVGCVRAPSGENQTVAEMEAQLAENQRRIEEQRAKALEAKYADLPDIAGLARNVMIFAHNLDVTFVGDSILLSAASSLVETFPKATIDGKVGRQLNQSADVVRQLEANGQLADIVVIVLGSNGPFTPEQLDDLADTIGKRTIFFVNTHVNRAWQDDVNAALTDYAKKHKNAYLIDWKAQVDQHPEWLYEDGTHCNPDGAAGFSNVVANALFKTLSDTHPELLGDVPPASGDKGAETANEQPATDSKAAAKEKKTEQSAPDKKTDKADKQEKKDKSEKKSEKKEKAEKADKAKQTAQKDNNDKDNKQA